MDQKNDTVETQTPVSRANGYATAVASNQVASEPAAKTIQTGRVLTRIWATPRVWGEITWRVSQIRTGSDSRGSGEYRSLHLEDLWDGMRGLYRAHKWIRRTERRRRGWLRCW